MRILIIGSDKEWAFENHYIKHLNNNQVRVDFFPAHDKFYNYYYRSNLNKILFRLNISSIYKKINRELIAFVSQNKFDIIWVFKGMEIYPKTLRTIKNKDIKLVNFNPDHPFIHTFRGSGNKNVINSIGLFDLHLCYNLAVKEQIEREFKLQCEWLPFGYEEAQITLPTKEQEIVKACFIGNPDSYRATIIINLARKGLQIELYGNNWGNWIKDYTKLNITIHPPVYKNNFYKVATQYRLQLNIFRPHNHNSHNMRTFEMPGLGCIMLAPESKEHNILFNGTEEAFFYKDDQELYNKSLSILTMNYETALVIRKNAINRSVTSKYSYRNRAIQVLDHFKELLNS